MLQILEPTGEVFEGQFGTFTVDKSDRLGVVIYRSSLAIATLAFGIGAAIALTQPLGSSLLQVIDVLFAVFCLGLGVALWTIHIYLAPLHKALQALWLTGSLGAVWVATQQSGSLIHNLYTQPIALLLSGWVFVALTGIFFKEAFCFNRLETKFLTFVVPIVLGGHWLGILPLSAEKIGLILWAVLMGVFAFRKLIQPIPPDLGDKSVFEYLHQKKSGNALS